MPEELDVLDQIITEAQGIGSASDEPGSEEPADDTPDDAATDELSDETSDEEGEGAPDPWADVREAGYGNLVDQYQGDPVKIFKALADAKAYITSGGQKTPEPQPEQQQAAPQPISSMPLAWPPESEEEFYAGVQAKPEQAALWAIANQNRLSSQQFQDAINNWHWTDPARATAYTLQRMLAEEQSRLAEQVKPLQERAAQDISTAAQALASQAIGDEFEAYREQIGSLLAEHPHRYFDPNGQESPEALSEAICAAYRDLKSREWFAQRNAPQSVPAAAAAKPRAASRAATQTRSSAAAPVATTDEQLAAKIIGA